MTTRHIVPARGFTLIELMVAVAIVGLLSSVAFPEYSRAVLRARAAERVTIMDAIARAVNDTVLQQQAIPGGTWNGVDNPPGVPGISKRKFDWSLAGWTHLPIVVDGDAYYSYSFSALDPGQDGKNVSLSVTGSGDLDGDGVQSVVTVTYTGVGYGFSKNTVPFEDPSVF